LSRGLGDVYKRQHVARMDLTIILYTVTFNTTVSFKYTASLYKTTRVYLMFSEHGKQLQIQLPLAAASDIQYSSQFTHL